MRKLESRLLVFGAGGQASKVIDAISSYGIRAIGYISTEEPGSVINGIKVLGNLEYYLQNKSLHKHSIHIAIGENSVRYEIFTKLQNLAANLISVISKTAVVSGNARIGGGSAVMHGAVVHTASQIGKCCLVDSRAIIEHHVITGDFVNVSPGAVICGGARLGRGVIIGAGSVIIEKITIGDNSLIGAGAVVIKDIPPDSVAVGNPAKVIKKRKFSQRYLK